MNELAELKRHIDARFDRLELLIIAGGEIIMADLSGLEAQVTQVQSVDQSAITLLNGLKAQLDAAIASNDPAKLQALSDSLGSSTSALAAAVAANTPAAPPAPAPTT